MCECACQKLDCERGLCEHEDTFRDDIVGAIRTRILPGLAELLKADRLAREELAGLEAEQQKLQRRARELENQVRELSQDQFGGEAVRRGILDANSEETEVRKQLDSLRHCLEPARSRAAHAKEDLGMKAQRMLRDLQPEFQAKLMNILDTASDLCGAWEDVVREIGVESGIDFGRTRLDPLAHPMISRRRFGQR